MEESWVESREARKGQKWNRKKIGRLEARSTHFLTPAQRERERYLFTQRKGRGVRGFGEGVLWA